MSKRKTMDKAQARERRNRLLKSAAAAELSLTEGVREMRAISGMTQEEFARHREVSARVIKALELGQGNPTVATLNRIGEFFGLEVGFVPIKRVPAADGSPAAVPEDLLQELTRNTGARPIDAFARQTFEEFAILAREILQNALDAQEKTLANIQTLQSTTDTPAGKKGKARTS